MRKSWVVMVVAAMLGSPVAAQGVAPSVPNASAPEIAAPDAATVAEWQAVIHGQIQAFRDHDAATALSFAAAKFHQQFTDPEAFLVGILNAGYAPIMESRSESFGPYEVMAPDVVDQDVKFVGNDQSLYEAVYRLQKEAAGWRVEAVVLVKKGDVGT